MWNYAAAGGAPDRAGHHDRPRRIAALRVVGERADPATCLGRHPARRNFTSSLQVEPIFQARPSPRAARAADTSSNLLQTPCLTPCKCLSTLPPSLGQATRSAAALPT